MAAAFVTSSMIGVDLQNASTTQQFALGTKVFGSNNSEWEYILASGSIATGVFVQCYTSGTAGPITTALLVYNSQGLDIGVAQFTISAGSYGFVAKRGNSLYALVSGSSVPGGAGLAFSAFAGAICTSLGAAAGNSAMGIFLTNSSNPAVADTRVVVEGLTMVWPRSPVVANPA